MQGSYLPSTLPSFHKPAAGPDIRLHGHLRSPSVCHPDGASSGSLPPHCQGAAGRRHHCVCRCEQGHGVALHWHPAQLSLSCSVLADSAWALPAPASRLMPDQHLTVAWSCLLRFAPRSHRRCSHACAAAGGASPLLQRVLRPTGRLRRPGHLVGNAHPHIHPARHPGLHVPNLRWCVAQAWAGQPRNCPQQRSPGPHHRGQHHQHQTETFRERWLAVC